MIKRKSTLTFFIICLVFISINSCHHKFYSSSISKNNRWHLVWHDEFNYTGLPDSTKWGYEVGHIRNNEQQYYTRARKENIWVANGVLTITGRKEQYPNEFYKAGSNDWRYKNEYAQYTSASINTLHKAGWKYGRIEIKAKVPHGSGMWPALWMMGNDIKSAGWPFCGEMDIMEFIGNHPNDIYGTFHFLDNSNKHLSSGSKTTSNTLLNDYHIYAIEWDSTKIDIYFDSIKYHSFQISDVGIHQDIFRKPFYLLINLAMGADWPGAIDDNVLPQQFIVDYVRVYQK